MEESFTEEMLVASAQWVKYQLGGLEERKPSTKTTWLMISVVLMGLSKTTMTNWVSLL